METGKNKEGSIGLSYPMLTKTNYTAWAMKMKVFMQAHGVWEAIEPKEPKDPKAAIEEKIDKRAMAVIYQGIQEDLMLTLAEKKTAKETWEAIRTVCQGADKVKKAKAQTLKGEFEALNMKEAEQIDEFYMKLNGLVTNIRALGENIEETYVVKKLLRAVPSKFLQIASAIEQFGNLEELTVEEVIGSLKAHEERIRGQVDVNEGKLLLTEDEWRKREQTEGQLLLTREEWLKRQRDGARSSGETRGREWVRGNRDRSKIRCFNCGAYGHYAAECRKPKRDRDNKPEVNLTQVDDEPTLLLVKVGDVTEDTVMLNEDNVFPGTKGIGAASETKSGEDSDVW